MIKRFKLLKKMLVILVGSMIVNSCGVVVSSFHTRAEMRDSVSKKVEMKKIRMVKGEKHRALTYVHSLGRMFTTMSLDTREDYIVNISRKKRLFGMITDTYIEAIGSGESTLYQVDTEGLFRLNFSSGMYPYESIKKGKAPYYKVIVESK